VADRPSDTKRPAKAPAKKRPGIVLVDKDAPSGKRRGAPAGSGQRPGFGRRKPE
jgi:23S rRNA pseudouridine2605 synthase